jgi:hypothetical protein
MPTTFRKFMCCISTSLFFMPADRSVHSEVQLDRAHFPTQSESQCSHRWRQRPPPARPGQWRAVTVRVSGRRAPATGTAQGVTPPQRLHRPGRDAVRDHFRRNLPDSGPGRGRVRTALQAPGCQWPARPGRGASDRVGRAESRTGSPSDSESPGQL